MNTNRVKRRLLEGGCAFGTNVFEFGTSGLLRIAASAGADFVMLDTQHSGWSGETLRTVLASRGGAELTTIVRVPTLDAHLVGQALDLGADGIMAPNVETAEDARALVRATRYPPGGDRGAAFGLSADDFQPVADLRARMDEGDREALLVALVESEAGIDHVAEIAAVDGIDVIWLGQFDLTLSMGIPGDFAHPRFAAAVDAVVEACVAQDKAAAFMATSAADGRALLERGFRVLSYANDVRIFRSALADGIRALREAVPPGHPR